MPHVNNINFTICYSTSWDFLFGILLKEFKKKSRGVANENSCVSLQLNFDKSFCQVVILSVVHTESSPFWSIELFIPAVELEGWMREENGKMKVR